MKLNITEDSPAEMTKASDIDFSNLETELRDHVIKLEVCMCLYVMLQRCTEA